MIVRRSFYYQFVLHIFRIQNGTSCFQRSRNDDGVEQLEIVLCGKVNGFG
jgi:hypothetical protein